MESHSDPSKSNLDETPLIVHSWDFDGMFAAKFYTEKMKDRIAIAVKEKRSLNESDFIAIANAIVDQYPEFFEERFNPEIKQEHIIYVGSDRQDVVTDFINGYKEDHNDIFATLSCFPFYEALAKVLQERCPGHTIKLDTLLLQDIYTMSDPGTTFANICVKYKELPLELLEQLSAQLIELDKATSYDVYKAYEAATLGNKTATVKSMPFPQYKDDTKFFIHYAQIHHANATHSHGRAFVYRFADDRFNILKPAENNLVNYLDYIPKGVEIQLEQFLPPESKAKLKQCSAENLFFGEYKQSIKLEGKGPTLSDPKTFIHDIALTHEAINSPIENSNIISHTLKLTINKRNTIDAIARSITLLKASKEGNESKGIKEIQELMTTYYASKEVSNETLLAAIKAVAIKKLSSNVKRYQGFELFLKKNSNLATFYKSLESLDPENPNPKTIEAACEFVEGQASTPKIKPLRSSKRIK